MASLADCLRLLAGVLALRGQHSAASAGRAREMPSSQLQDMRVQHQWQVVSMTHDSGART